MPTVCVFLRLTVKSRKKQKSCDNSRPDDTFPVWAVFIVKNGKKKIRQFENREKMLRQKLSKEERRTRSHRLIVRGAVFESIVPEAKNMSDEEAAALLRFALTSEPVQEYLKKRAENGDAE